jgi:hypothetical protein
VEIPSRPLDPIRPFMQRTSGTDGSHHATSREEEEAERPYEEAEGDVSPKLGLPPKPLTGYVPEQNRPGAPTGETRAQ